MPRRIQRVFIFDTTNGAMVRRIRKQQRSDSSLFEVATWDRINDNDLRIRHRSMLMISALLLLGACTVGTSVVVATSAASNGPNGISSVSRRRCNSNNNNWTIPQKLGYAMGKFVDDSRSVKSTNQNAVELCGSKVSKSAAAPVRTMSSQQREFLKYVDVVIPLHFVECNVSAF